MKFGVREICDVVLRAKTAQKIGNKIFYKNEPVCYFDTLKTSTLEGAATTVYATGGRGNARLMSWDGERTVTFTMEDALISPIGLSILTGAGLIESSNSHPVYQHISETISKTGEEWYITQEPYDPDNEITIYGMIVNESGEVVSEPYLFRYDSEGSTTGHYHIVLAKDSVNLGRIYDGNTNEKVVRLETSNVLLVDYYVQHTTNSFEVNISPSSFGGSFYLEASTLWRDQGTGKDLPAEFIIPNCRIQSNFSFSMSSSGDPSTFTFTIDAFPDYTRWNKTEKVLADIQVIGANLNSIADYGRPSTWTEDYMDANNNLITEVDNRYYSPLVITNLIRTKAGNVSFTVKDTNVYAVGKSNYPDYRVRYILSDEDSVTVTAGYFTDDSNGVTLQKSIWGNYGAWSVDLSTILEDTNVVIENNKEYKLKIYCENLDVSLHQSEPSKTIYIPIRDPQYLILKTLVNPITQQGSSRAISFHDSGETTLPSENTNGVFNLSCYKYNSTNLPSNIVTSIKGITIKDSPKTVRSLDFYLNTDLKVTEKIIKDNQLTLSDNNLDKTTTAEFLNDYMVAKINPKVYVRYRKGVGTSTEWKWVLASTGTAVNSIENDNFKTSIQINKNIFTVPSSTDDVVYFGIQIPNANQTLYYAVYKTENAYKIARLEDTNILGKITEESISNTKPSGFERFNASTQIETDLSNSSSTKPIRIQTAGITVTVAADG